MKKLLAAIGLVTLGACTVPADSIEPVVTQFNGDSVAIQIPGHASYATPEQKAVIRQNVNAEANRICRQGHKKRAVPASQRTIPVSQYTAVHEFLFLCLN